MTSSDHSDHSGGPGPGRGRRAATGTILALAGGLVALAALLAVRTFLEQRSEHASSYGVLGYAGAFVLGVLGLLSLSLARDARRSGSTVLLVGAALPLLLVVAFVVAAGT